MTTGLPDIFPERTGSGTFMRVSGKSTVPTRSITGFLPTMRSATRADMPIPGRSPMWLTAERYGIRNATPLTRRPERSNCFQRRSTTGMIRWFRGFRLMYRLKKALRIRLRRLIRCSSSAGTPGDAAIRSTIIIRSWSAWSRRGSGSIPVTPRQGAFIMKTSRRF